jgi:hypothetical protein
MVTEGFQILCVSCPGFEVLLQALKTERMLGLPKDFQNFRCGWHAVRSSQRDKLLHIVVIAFRIDETDLIVSLQEPLD